MAGKPTGPPPPERSGARTGADRLAAKKGLSERYGPLVLARHAKDDGRALILYARAEREPSTGTRGEPE